MVVTSIQLTLNSSETSRFLASVTATVDNAIALTGIRLGRRDDGSLYLLMPATRRTDGSFREPFHPISNAMREAFSRPIFDHYDRVLEDETLSGKRIRYPSDSSLNITDVNIYRLENSSNGVMAIATVTLDEGFVLKGIRVIDRDGKISLRMSSYPRYPEGPDHPCIWVEHYHPVSRSARNQLTEAIGKEYRKA